MSDPNSLTTAELKELSRKLREAQVRTNSDDECGPNPARKNLFQSPIKKAVSSDKQKEIDNMIGISYAGFNNVLETGGKAMRLVGISTTPKDVPDSPFPFPTFNSRDNSRRRDELHKEKPRKDDVHSNKRSFDKSDLTLQSFHDITAKHVDKLNMEKLDVTQLISHGNNTAKSIDKSDVTQPTSHSTTAKGVNKLDLTQLSSHSITTKNVEKSDATQSSSHSITSKNVDKSVVTQQNSHVIAAKSVNKLDVTQPNSYGITAKSVDKLDVTQPSSHAITAKNVEESHLTQQNSRGITAKSDRRSGSHSSSRASHSGKECSSSPNSHKSQKTSPTPSPSKLLKSDAGNKVSISKSHGSGSHHSNKSPEEQLTGTQPVRESLADLKFLNSASKDTNSRIIDNKTQELLPMSKPPNGLVPHQSKPKPKLNIPEKPDVEDILMEMAHIQTPLTRINTPLKEKPLNFETKPRDNVFSTFEPLLPLPEMDEPCLTQNPSREEEAEEHMGEIESKASTERNVTAEPIAPITVKDEASTGTSSHVTAVKHPTTAPVKERRKKMPDSSESSSGESDSSSASGSDSDSLTSDDDDDEDEEDDEDDEEKREEYKREEKVKPASPFLVATTLSPPSPTEGKPQQAKWSLSTYLPQSKNPLFSAPLSDTRTPLDGESNITTKLDTENNRVSERNSVSNDALILGISKRTYRNSCSSVELSPDARSTTSNSSTKPGRKPSAKHTPNHSTSEKMFKEKSSSVNNQYVSPKRIPLSSKNGSAPTKESIKDKQDKGSRIPRTNRMKKGNKSPKRILSKEFVDSDSSSSESTEERPAVVTKSEPQSVVVTTKCIPRAKSSSVSSDSEEVEEERKMEKGDGNDSKDDQSEEEADSSIQEVFSKSMKSPFISKPSPLPVYVQETRRCEPKECDINSSQQKDQLDISGSLSKNESMDDIFTSTANSFNLLSPIPHDGPDGVFKRPPDKKPSIMVHLDREFIKSLLQKVNIEGIKSPTPNLPTKADLSSSSDSDSSSDSVCSDMEEGQLKDEDEEVENKVEESEKSLFLEYSLKESFNSKPISPLRDSDVNFAPMDTVSRFSPIKIHPSPAKERLHEKRKLDINRHEDAKRRKSEPSRSPMKFSGDEIPEKEKDSHEDDRKWDRKHPDRLRERRGSGESISSHKSQKDRQIKKLKDHKNAAPDQEVVSTVKQKFAENSKPPTAVAEPLQQNGMAHFPPSSTPSRLEASPQVKGQAGWPPRLAHWPEDGKLESYEIYYARAKELKSHADSTLDILQKHLLLMEAALNFIQCAYVMERDHVPDPIKMYGETLRFVHHRCRFHSSLESDANDRERKLSVLSYRIQSMLNLKLFKKNEALKLKRVLDDYHKNFQNSASKPVSGVPAPSPIQNKSSTGTPSPMSPTASPATSICSEMSQGSDPTPSKIPNGSGPISTTHATVNLPQRIHSVIQQYVNMTNSVLMCHDLWDQANTMASAPDIRDFFAQLEYKCGILTRDSSMMDLVYYVKEALRTLQPT